MENRVVLVTGAGSGIGRAVCLELAQKKSKVVLADISVDGCSETVRLMKEIDLGVQSLVVRCDVTKQEDVNHMIEETVKVFGRLDSSVNCAGILGDNLIGLERDVINYKSYDKVMDINAKGTWLCLQAEVAQMTKQPPAQYSIVNLSSIAGTHGVATPGYVCSKHAVIGLTKSLAVECGPLGIRVNCVSPGATLTPLLENGFSTVNRSSYDNLCPLKRSCQPGEIAKPILFLLSPIESSYVNGLNLVVDGGFTVL